MSTTRSTAIREARRGERRDLYRSLALAFEDDPVSCFLHPEPESRAARLERSYGAMVPTLTRHGVMYCDDGLGTAAIWQLPSPPRLSLVPQLLFNLRIALALGSALPRGRILGELLQKHHIPEPHWYLAILGTRPDQQGKGLGSSAMQPVLTRCDREGSLAYLESSKESNIPFYQRHGFEVVGEIAVPDGPTLWPMKREPR